jgi:predicted MPP superfamily phosphohydrolase
MEHRPRRKISRRSFLRAAMYGTGGAFLAGTGAYTVDARAEPGQLRLEAVEVAIPELPAVFDGYRIIQLTDLHFGPAIAYRTVSRAVRVALDRAPDMIVLTGDYVTYWLDRDLLHGVLHQLSAPDGVWAVLGNHDHWVDPAGVRRILAGAGVAELQNAGVRVERQGEALWLAGVDDIWEQRHDLSAALADIPTGAVTILLAHEPDYADEVAPTGRVALQLSGHSHGGQMCLPVLDVPVLSNFVHLARKYPRGLYKIGDMWLYTSAGVGHGPTPRVYASPEVTEIILRQEGAG